MQRRLGRVAPWAIGAVVALAVLASGLLLASALATQRAAAVNIRHSLANVLALHRTEALMVDAETAQRGFVLTGDPSYLAPYQRTRAQLPGELDGLRLAGVLGPDEPLPQLIDAKMKELGATIELASSGRKDQALAIVNSGSGKRYMDQIRAGTDRLVGVQQRQLDSALTRSERHTTRIDVGLALVAAAVILLLWLGLRLLLRTRALEAEATRLHEVETAERQTALIARELNHRVKNLFSVVLAIVQLSGRGAASAQEAVASIRERVQALGRAHDVSLGTDPMSGFELEAILRTILTPYVSDPTQLQVDGPAVQLPPMRATPIGLIFHELATNALKYGAWSSKGGQVTVRWSVIEAGESKAPPGRMLSLRWDERGSDPLPPEGEPGFGSKMIGALVAQLGGSIVRERRDHGLSIVINAPIVPFDQPAA